MVKPTGEHAQSTSETAPQSTGPEAPAVQPKRAAPIHWVTLFVSAVLEAIWALALDASAQFTVLGPSVIFAVTCTISMFGLAYAMRGIPISVAYAIWTGLGAALTVTISMLMGTESASVLKLLFLAGIVGCVVGLKFVNEPPPR